MMSEELKSEKVKDNEIDYNNFQWITADLIILSETVTIIFIISVHCTENFDKNEEDLKTFITSLVKIIYILLFQNL